MEYESTTQVLAVEAAWPYKIHLAESDCDETEEWSWEWDDAGEWGSIVPKTRPHQAIDVNRSNKKASLYNKHNGSNQKFKPYGKWIISKAFASHALTIDADGNLVVAPIECASDKFDFATIHLTCDKPEDEPVPEPEPET